VASVTSTETIETSSHLRRPLVVLGCIVRIRSSTKVSVPWYGPGRADVWRIANNVSRLGVILAQGLLPVQGTLAVLAVTLLAMFANCMLFSIVWNWINYESRWSGGVQLALQLILIGTPVLNTVVLWLYLYQRDRERRLRLSVAKADHESVTDG
jgi:hypothetical protein